MRDHQGVVVETILNHIKVEKANLYARIATLEADESAAERTLELLVEYAGLSEAQVTELYPNVHLSDLADCHNYAEALIAMARKNDGILKITPAGRCLVEAGFAKGKVESAVSTAHNICSKSEDTWAWAESGTFRLVEWKFYACVPKPGS